jgi:NAD+ synthase
VRQLAAYLGVSQSILEKAPSPDLIPGIVDELALGVDYESMDKILWGLERGWDRGEIAKQYSLSADMVEHVWQLVSRSWHLRELPPMPKLD